MYVFSCHIDKVTTGMIGIVPRVWDRDPSKLDMRTYPENRSRNARGPALIRFVAVAPL